MNLGYDYKLYIQSIYVTRLFKQQFSIIEQAVCLVDPTQDHVWLEQFAMVI